MSAKIRKEYSCTICDYYTRDKKDWMKHISTRKHIKNHKMITNDNEMITIPVKNVDFVCKYCNKTYKYKSGLSRHKKNCKKKHKNNIETIIKKSANKSANNYNPDMVKTLNEFLSSDKKKLEMMEQLIKQNEELSKNVGNNNNNKISINVFLNEHCKDAMNLTDFVQKIEISNEDLLYTQQYGYTEGISNIFMKYLTDMKTTERPIHCSDKKRLQFYIKDENKWHQDKNNKIDNTIQAISNKQLGKIKEWEEQHPNYLNDESLLKEWHEIVKKSVGSYDAQERIENHKLIKKNISGKILVKSALDTSEE